MAAKLTITIISRLYTPVPTNQYLYGEQLRLNVISLPISIAGTLSLRTPTQTEDSSWLDNSPKTVVTIGNMEIFFDDDTEVVFDVAQNLMVPVTQGATKVLTGSEIIISV